jgi:hypothetical protein
MAERKSADPRSHHPAARPLLRVILGEFVYGLYRQHGKVT